MALGAMLVAGAAAPAFAASQIDFKGWYRIHQMNDWNQNYDTDKDLASDDTGYFINRLNLDFTFNATDEVAVYWRVRGPASERWGSSNIGLISQWLYGEVKTDAGTFSIGKLANDFTYLGLANLGHSLTYVDGDTAYGYGSPFDVDAPSSGIRWANSWDGGFQLVAQFTRLATAENSKYIETDPGSAGPPVVPPSGIYQVSPETHDLFILQPAYLWDGGGATLALIYERDHVGDGDDWDFNATPNPKKSGGVNDPAWKGYFVNPAVSHSFGDFTVNFEGKAGWGKAPDEKGEDEKDKGYAFYLDFDYNYGPGNVTLAGWWASGSKDGDDKMNDLVDFGSFAPFLVAYNTGDWNLGYYEGTATSRKNTKSRTNAIATANELSGTGGGPTGMANHMALALMGAHAFTDDVTLQYGLGYLSLNQAQKGKKKDIGYEGDLGVKVQLLDNVSFTTNFGYLMAGKALEIEENGTKKKEDAYSWYNTLTFSF